MGRPSSYSDELAIIICASLAQGISLREICEADDIPAERTVYGWLSSNEAFSQDYARARKVWADAQIEEVIAISKDPELRADDKRVQIDTLKWAMGKLNGKYNDKLTIESKSEVTHRYDLDSLDDAKLDQLESILADAATGAGSEGATRADSVH